MKNVLGVLVVLVLLCLGFIGSRPSRMHVERSATMTAPSDVVFAQLDNFHHWAQWSPWEKLDPQMKTTFSGPDSGLGAIYEWSGNDKVGQGRMTITESTPSSKVAMKLEFLKPFQDVNTTTFTLDPAGPETKVTWAMDGTNSFMEKAVGLFMNMDKTIGGDFERGLGTLKTVAEAQAQSAAADSIRNAVAPPTRVLVQ